MNMSAVDTEVAEDFGLAVMALLTQYYPRALQRHPVQSGSFSSEVGELVTATCVLADCFGGAMFLLGETTPDTATRDAVYESLWTRAKKFAGELETPSSPE